MQLEQQSQGEQCRPRMGSPSEQGGFVAGTRLRLADGRDVAVEELGGSEMLFRPVSTRELPAGVSRRTERGELLLVALETEHGQRLDLPERQPLVVSRHGLLELLPAGRLRLGDELLSVPLARGPRLLSRVTRIERRRHTGPRYTVQAPGGDSELDHLLVVNGLVVGDRLVQEWLDSFRRAVAA